MNQRIVAFTGISGVGKTTFLRRLAELINFQHVTAGSLIATARKVVQEARDSIRYADLEENQRLLIDGFLLTRDPNSNLIIIDGHVVVDDGEELSKVSSEVFRELEISLMVHLECDPARIASNRNDDTSRIRPAYTLDVLGKHQLTSRYHAQSIADVLGVPIYIVTQNDTNHLAELLVIN